MPVNFLKIGVCFLLTAILPLVSLAEMPSKVVSLTSADRGKRSLLGIESMHVLVEVLNDNAAISTVELQALDGKLHKLLREELTKVGIPLLDAVEYKKVPGTPVLYLNVHPLKPADQDFFVVTLSLEVKQVVLLGRQQSEPLLATTWMTNGAGIVPGDLEKYVPTFAAELTKRFIADYLAANKDK